MPLIRGLAVSTDIDPPASPCGMCRQFINEFCSTKMKVWMYGKSWDEGSRGEGEVTVMTIGDLLPLSFNGRDMVSVILLEA